MFYNGNNKDSMDKKKQIEEMYADALYNDEAPNVFADRILALFSVVGQSEQLNCEHEWKVDTFDCYGFPVEQYCDKCDKKEAI